MTPLVHVEKVSVETTGNGATAFHSENEKSVVEGAIGRPDIDHEDIAGLDRAHMVDLERAYSQVSTKAEPRKDNNHFSRVSTRQSTHSRISTSLNSRSKKSRLPPAALPISDLNKGIVGWQSQEDPEMPLNFTERRKWTLIALLASISFISPLASSMFAPGVSFMSQEFNNDSAILQSLTVSIFVLGYAIGPLFLAPLSEIYGRRFVITGANAFFCVWQIGCALAPNLQSLIIFRFLTGVGGSGCLTIGGGVIADLFPPDRRGIASAVYSLGPLFGPVVGPVCGGFIAQRAGWRWVFWILLIAGTFVSLCIELLTRETNHRVLIHRKLRRLQQKLNRPGLKSCYDETTGPAPTPTQVLLFGITRPLKMLFCSPIIFLVSLYMAVCYGLLYLLFTTITQVFSSTYGWSPEICGLAYIALGPGYVGALAIVARISDATVVRMTKANDGIFEPEMRLPACIFFACFIPITFFWYGWSADKGVHWIVPILGLMPFGFGIMGVWIPIQTYTIDSFPEFAASGIAALTVMRSVFGAFLPLAGPTMYESLGLGWGNSALGFIAIGLIPAPLFIYRFGGRIRKNYPVKL